MPASKPTQQLPHRSPEQTYEQRCELTRMYAHEALEAVEQLPAVHGELRFMLWPYDVGLTILAILMETGEGGETLRMHSRAVRISKQPLTPQEVEARLVRLKAKLTLLTERLSGKLKVVTTRPAKGGNGDGWLGEWALRAWPHASARRDH